MKDINIIIAIIGLSGVIIGGIIASFGNFISLIFDYRKDQKEKRIEYLKLKRERIEKMFQEMNGKILEALAEENWDIDMMATFPTLTPNKVNEVFQEIMRDKSKDLFQKKSLFFKLKTTMKESLKEIDKEIEKEINKKFLWFF